MSAFARNQLISAPSGLDRAGLAAPPLRAVDEDGAPLPIVQARYVVGDPGALAADQDESEPNGALKQPGRDVSRRRSRRQGRSGFRAPGFNAKRLNGKRSAAEPYAIKSWPREVEDPRDDEFDPGHTMSPQRPADGDDGRTGGDRVRGWRDAGRAARIRAQLLFAHLQRRRRGCCRGR